MRLLIATAIAVSVLYFWDANYENGKFTDGLFKMAGSIARNYR